MKDSIKKLLALPVEERLRLADALWASIPDHPQAPITDEEKRMLDARLADADAHPETGIPLETALQQMDDVIADVNAER